MNTTLFLLLALPIVIPIACKYAFSKLVRLSEIARWKLVGAAVGVGLVLTFAAFYGGKATKTHDTEILNGQVTHKEKNRVSCSHSYSCHCRTDSKGNTSCDTCYEHSHDYNWDVYSTVGELTIDRIDRQGAHEPPRWTVVMPGQPVAMDHGYTNYVKAVPESVFRVDTIYSKEKLKNIPVPGYPLNVYDYHYVD